MSTTVSFTVDGRSVEVPDDAGSLLDALRDHLGVRSVKDGCSPQGQCGCCTVLVDGAPRVACVTPVRRAAGREVTTVDGLDTASTWAEALCASGGSQCGFCTPGIVVRLDALREKGRLADPAAVESALLAHVCRCTGWQTVVEAAVEVAGGGRGAPNERDLDAAAQRAALEGGVPQAVGPEVALGRGGFADDLAPADALVAVTDGEGGWAVAPTLAEARRLAGKVQGRRSTLDPAPPIELPEVEGATAALRTSWVDPAYLETDASWCAPGGTPASPLGNGGAFGGKLDSPVVAAAAELAERHGRPVRVCWSREDVIRRGPKRPPVAGAARPDGTGVMRVARTDGIADRIAAVAPGLDVVEVDLAGPPTSAAVRCAGVAEALALIAGARGEVGPVELAGGRAMVEVGTDGALDVEVWAGDPLDEIVLRSYVVGAAHFGLSLVTSEGLAVDEGEVVDLTMRSMGVLRAVDTPRIRVTIHDGGPPVPVSEAVVCATAAAVWLARGCPTDWPVGT